MVSETEAGELSQFLEQLSKAAIGKLRQLTISALPLNYHMTSIAVAILPSSKALTSVTIEFSEALDEHTLRQYLSCLKDNKVACLTLCGQGSDSQIKVVQDSIQKLPHLTHLCLQDSNIWPEGWLATWLKNLPLLCVDVHLAPNQSIGSAWRLSELLLLPRCDVSVQDGGLFGVVADLFQQAKADWKEPRKLCYLKEAGRPVFTTKCPSFSLTLQTNDKLANFLDAMEATSAFDTLRIEKALDEEHEYVCLAELFRRNSPSLRSLEVEFQSPETFKGNLLAAFRDFSDAFRENTAVTSLHLAHCTFEGTDNQRALVQLSQCKTLEELNMIDVLVGHSDRAVDVFFEGLSTSRRLRKLHLSSSILATPAGDKTVRQSRMVALGRAICGSSLRWVTLSKCSINSIDMLALVEGLHNARLERLNLSNNKICDGGVIVLARALRNNEIAVSELVLAQTGVGDDALIALAWALETNEHVRSLDLSRNCSNCGEPSFGSRSMFSLSMSLPRMQMLSRLRVDLLPKDESAVSRLQTAMLENKSLNHIGEIRPLWGIHRVIDEDNFQFIPFNGCPPGFHAGPARNLLVQELQVGKVSGAKVAEELACLDRYHGKDALFGVLRSSAEQILQCCTRVKRGPGES